MSLVNMKEMLREARKAKKAVGAFNITNYETAAAVLKAAEAENEPVIIQLYMRLFDTGKAYDLCGMLQRLACRGKVPVALHLDHGNTVKQATDALAWGYTSVMYDGSRAPYDENVKGTRHVADYAHALGATCEGEIGHVAQGDETALTDVAEAAAFAQATGVDALAVSIGTAHGFYVGTPVLDKARLSEIRKVVDIPLVLHGASGLTDQDVRDCVARGICKVNFATELRKAFTDACRKVAEDDPKAFDPKVFCKAGMAAVKELVMNRMKICGCDGKADGI